MKPVSAEFENFLCYVEETIDFEALPPIVCITGRAIEGATADDNNGAGKSSLVDGPAWALYGRVRGSLNKQLVNTDVIHIDANNEMADYARVTYIFEIDRYFKVMREITAGGKQTLEFYVSEDKKIWNSLTLTAGVNKRTGKKESSISRTQQRINDILNCNCDLFINSIYFEQGNTNTFATSKPAQREELLKDALYLDEWADYGKEAKARNRKLEKEIYAVEYALEKNDVEVIAEKNQEYEESIEAYGIQIKKSNESIRVDEDKAQRLKTELLNIENTVEKYNTLVGEVNDLAESHGKVQEEIDDLDKEISDDVEVTGTAAKKITIQKDLQRTAEEMIGGAELDWSQVPKKAPDRDNLETLIKEEVTILSAGQHLKSEKEKLANGECPMDNTDCDYASCENKDKKKKQINAKIFKNRGKHSKKVKEVEEQRVENKHREKNKERLVALEKTIAQGKISLNGAIKEIEHLKEKRTEKEASLKKNRKKRMTLTNELEHLSKAYETKNELVENYDMPDASNLEDEFNLLEEKIKDCKTTIEDVARRKTDIETKLKINEKTLEDMEEYRQKHITLNDSKRVMEYTVKILTKEIPHQLIEAALPEIEGYAKEFIHDLSNGRYDISFITQKEIKKRDKETKEYLKSDSLDIMVDIDGKTLKYAQTSGGQRARADIAIHLGYSAFLLNRSGARLECLFLDEVASALDKSGKDSLLQLLEKLIKKHGFKQIFLISQDERLNKLFDTILTVVQTEKGSKICY